MFTAMDLVRGQEGLILIHRFNHGAVGDDSLMDPFGVAGEVSIGAEAGVFGVVAVAVVGITWAAAAGEDHRPRLLVGIRATIKIIIGRGDQDLDQGRVLFRVQTPCQDP